MNTENSNYHQNDFTKKRTKTLGNQIETLVLPKKNFEKILKIDDKKTIERRHSFTISTDNNTPLTFEELKQNNFDLMKELTEIKTSFFKENTSEIDIYKNHDNNYQKYLNRNSSKSESIDGRISLSCSKSLSNISKNDFLIDNFEQNTLEKNLMKDKFIEIDLKYLNNVKYFFSKYN